ncbi:MAG TPA: hypothetical protein PLJ27_07585, partial [Polyangiaceae bacterium]|nr:hypothetical protein [Polyangiaceae bacterium]
MRFDAANPKESVEGIGRKPRATVLTLEALADVRHFPAARRPIQLNIEVWRPQVSVVLDDLVFEDQVIPEGVPGQFADQPMVLVQVMTVVRENDVGLENALQLLEGVLDFRADVREVAVPKSLGDDRLLRAFSQKHLRALDRFLGPRGLGAENDPVNLRAFQFREQTEDCSAAADLDIVAMRPEKQQAPKRFFPATKKEREHFPSLQKYSANHKKYKETQVPRINPDPKPLFTTGSPRPRPTITR